MTCYMNMCKGTRCDNVRLTLHGYIVFVSSFPRVLGSHKGVDPGSTRPGVDRGSIGPNFGVRLVPLADVPISSLHRRS